ncbi:hypothetical protein GCM10027073_53170 [Streptomyces chlorus]
MYVGRCCAHAEGPYPQVQACRRPGTWRQFSQPDAAGDGGMTMREIERKHAVTWRTVRKDLGCAWLEPRKKLPPRPMAIDPHNLVIDAILRADLDAPRKQRHTRGHPDLSECGK